MRDSSRQVNLFLRLGWIGTAVVFELLSTLFFWSVAVRSCDAAESISAATLADLSFEQLLETRVTSATLTGSDRRRVPANITTITHEDIRDSGANDLFELLEMYVPNLLYLSHNYEATHIGFQGIISDRDNKYLLLVNGKVMNQLTHAGALSERDLRMLGDIREIQVVRGPASAVYGAGAIAGVIDIRTFDGTNFKGTEVTSKVGVINEYYTAEVRGGYRLAEEVHLFLYGGITHQVGYANSDGPYIASAEGLSWSGLQNLAGQPFRDNLPRAGGAYRGLPPLKFHAELTLKDLSIWARYTRGGENLDVPGQLLSIPTAAGFHPGWNWGPFVFTDHNATNGWFPAQSVGYQQISSGADWKRDLSESWSLSARLGYDLFDYERSLIWNTTPSDANREDKITARVLAQWEPSPRHNLAFGVEYTRGEFGFSSLGWPGTGAVVGGLGSFPSERWGTSTFSPLAEYQWELNSKWSLFSSLRFDKNDYTPWMFSPRAAWIFTPTKKDTFKWIFSQATKANFAEELRLQHLQSGTSGQTETMKAIEWGYSRLIADRMTIGVNTFYHHYTALGWDNGTVNLGTEDTVGGELEVAWQTPRFRLSASHGITQLLKFEHPSANQTITASPYGFGTDLNHWSTHISKVTANYRPIDTLRFYGSLRIFWGWPGWAEYKDYINSIFYATGASPNDSFATEPAGYNPYKDLQARLNLGVSYDVTPHVTVGVHGYNLLGLFEGSLNNRFLLFSSNARQDPVSAMLSVSVKW